MSEYVDLVMENGELIRIECPAQHIDQLHDSIENSMKRRDWFCVNQFDGCNAQYMGHSIDRVNMGKVVARL